MHGDGNSGTFSERKLELTLGSHLGFLRQGPLLPLLAFGAVLFWPVVKSMTHEQLLVLSQDRGNG